LVRFGQYDAEGQFDPMLSRGGPQPQDRSVPGYPAESLPDGSIVTTALLAPAIAGWGLLQALDENTIMQLADEDAADGDGTSERVNWIEPTVVLTSIVSLAERGAGGRLNTYGDYYVGRFGRKASNISLLHQTFTAFHQDMGLTSDFAL
jgi:CxxC motif-containing protein (DUF1111 family)